MPAPLHLEAAGVSFPMVVAGEGPPILFVHGAWADLRIWCGLWKQISERHKFLAITQRHFGRRGLAKHKTLFACRTYGRFDRRA